MTYDDQNIFARILRGELPAIKVYEDDQVLAFMDIMPQADGHTLVVPKAPAITLLDLDPEAAAYTIQIVQKVAKAIEKGLGVDGIVLMQLSGSPAGHLPAHILHGKRHRIDNAKQPHRVRGLTHRAQIADTILKEE